MSSTAPQQVKITVSRKLVVRVLALFIVLVGLMTDFWEIALLSGSGTAYETTLVVFNILSVAVALAVGVVLWVLAD